jgi:hypothetical protein
MPKYFLKLLLILFVILCHGENTIYSQSESYSFLGQKPPGLKPIRFSKKIITNDFFPHSRMIISPVGDRIYWTTFLKVDSSDKVLYYSDFDGSSLSPAIRETALSKYGILNFIFSNDKNKILFGSRQPYDKMGGQLVRAVWTSEKSESGWSKPQPIENTVDTDWASLGSVSINKKGDIYFSGRKEGKTAKIYCSRFVKGKYKNYKALPEIINSGITLDPFIDFQDRFILFAGSGRPDNTGTIDLFISYKDENGEWIQPCHLGKNICTQYCDRFPMVSKNGKYFFFVTSHSDHFPSARTHFYWVDTRAIGLVDTLITAHSDYNGDGMSDLSVFNPRTKKWNIMDQFKKKFGKNDSVPVPGDYNGDSRADLAFFHPSSGLWKVKGQWRVKNFGKQGDIPVPNDYNGDGQTDIAFYRPYDSTWHFHNQDSAPDNMTVIAFGEGGDIPVPGDYDGDGKTDVAVFRPVTKKWKIRGGDSIKFGKSMDIPVPADYDGDGKTDIAVWTPEKGKWSIYKQYKRKQGKMGDIPVPGDYDGDGKIDIATYDPFTCLWNVHGQFEIKFGEEGDLPLVRGK